MCVYTGDAHSFARTLPCAHWPPLTLAHDTCVFQGDVLCYDVPEFGSTCADMNQTDPLMCLEMDRYEELATFANSTGLKLVFGLNAVW